MGIGIGAGLAALAFWLFVAAVAVAGIWDGIRKREAKHETLRRVLESGQPIDPALMNELLMLIGGGSDNLDRDLKVGGLITLFIAPGLALLGIIIGISEEAALFPLLGVAVLVGFVSIGLLVASRYVKRSSQEDEKSIANRRKV